MQQVTARAAAVAGDGNANCRSHSCICVHGSKRSISITTSSTTQLSVHSPHNALSSMTPPSDASSLLASVAVLCRERDALAALSHVAAAISEYADASLGYELWQAAATGNLTLLQRVHTMRSPMSLRSKNAVELAIEAAALNGHLHVVRWLHHAFPERKNKTWAVDIAAEHGHLAIIQWLHEAKSTIDRASMAAMDEAARNGRLDIVQWLHANRSEGCTTRAMDCAARQGHLEVVQWLHANRDEGCTTQAMDWAAAAGHLPVVQWLHEHRREGCSSMAIDNAAANGHLGVVVWLHQHRELKWTSNAERLAATRGHDHVLEWLRRNAVAADADAAIVAGETRVPQLAATAC